MCNKYTSLTFIASFVWRQHLYLHCTKNDARLRLSHFVCRLFQLNKEFLHIIRSDQIRPCDHSSKAQARMPDQACVKLVYTTPPKLVFGRDRDHLTTYLQPNLNFKSTTSIKCYTFCLIQSCSRAIPGLRTHPEIDSNIIRVAPPHSHSHFH